MESTDKNEGLLEANLLPAAEETEQLIVEGEEQRTPSGNDIEMRLSGSDVVASPSGSSVAGMRSSGGLEHARELSPPSPAEPQHLTQSINETQHVTTSDGSKSYDIKIDSRKTYQPPSNEAVTSQVSSQ